jgi:hypothetical protein
MILQQIRRCSLNNLLKLNTKTGLTLRSANNNKFSTSSKLNGLHYPINDSLFGLNDEQKQVNFKSFHLKLRGVTVIYNIIQYL